MGGWSGWSGVGDTPKTAMTTRAPVVLKKCAVTETKSERGEICVSVNFNNNKIPRLQGKSTIIPSPSCTADKNIPLASLHLFEVDIGDFEFAQDQRICSPEEF